jgi:hypothetical protein
VENTWHVVKSTVEVRPGNKTGWIEVQVTAPDGKSTSKYIMKKVSRFYSEADASTAELV